MLLGGGTLLCALVGRQINIAVMGGRSVGFDSWYFALSIAFASIVMYDSAGVRRAAGKQASLLNKIIRTFTYVSL